MPLSCLNLNEWWPRSRACDCNRARLAPTPVIIRIKLSISLVVEILLSCGCEFITLPHSTGMVARPHTGAHHANTLYRGVLQLL